MVPVHIMESPSPSVFRSNLKKYFLNQYKDNSTRDHEFMGNSMRGHSDLSFLYQIRVAWWGLIDFESLIHFFSSVNIKYKFDLLQRFLVVSLP